VHKTFKSILIALLGLFALGSFASVQAANILIVAGTNGQAQSAASILQSELQGTNTVTIVNTGVPASLAGYTQIYDTRFDNNPAFSPAEQAQYVAFLNAATGNTLFLMGENSSFTPRNQPINDFIALAGGGSIAVPATTSGNTEDVHAPFNSPNAISTVQFAACGVVTSAGTGSFASSEPGGTSGCALYFSQGTLANAPQGGLVVVYDVNFISDDYLGVNVIQFRQNMENYVATGAPPVTPSTPTSIPTLSEWGMILLSSLLALGTIITLRRQRQ
jgi:hypothetical protein